MSSSSSDKLRVKRLFPNYSYWGWCSLFNQEQPTIRRSKYCLKFSNARESPKISGQPFPFFQPVFLHILLPRQCDNCSKIISPEHFGIRTILSLDFSNEGTATPCPRPDPQWHSSKFRRLVARRKDS